MRNVLSVCRLFPVFPAHHSVLCVLIVKLLYLCIIYSLCLYVLCEINIRLLPYDYYFITICSYQNYYYYYYCHILRPTPLLSVIIINIMYYFSPCSYKLLAKWLFLFKPCYSLNVQNTTGRLSSLGSTK